MKITSRFALLTLLLAGSVYGGEFEPVSVSHSGSFELDVPPEKAIYLFTTPGEILWAPGWDPDILSGDGWEVNTVFVTSPGEDDTIWVVVDFDVHEFRARYARITPGSRAGTVEVRLQSNDKGGSSINVTYKLTALSESGDQYLAHFDDKAHAEMLIGWEKHIRQADIDYSALIPE